MLFVFLTKRSLALYRGGLHVKKNQLFSFLLAFAFGFFLLTNHRTDSQARKDNGMTENDSFACAIICIDGRVQEAVRDYMVKNHGVRWVDRAPAPGPVKILTENSDEIFIESIRRDMETSIKHHRSKVISISAHPKCAGNPVSDEKQIEQLRLAKKTVESWGFPVEIVLLWVHDDWETVTRIDE